MNQTKLTLDWLTVAAMAAFIFALTIGLHETTHAVTCEAVGGKLTEYSALYVQCDNLGLWQDKIVSGSASIFNLVLGTLAWLWFRAKSHRLSPEQKYFWWLFILINWLGGAGYWMFSGFSGLGDWAVVISDLQPLWAWRVLMAVFGSIVYMGFIFLALKEFGRIVGGHEPELYGRAQKLTTISYFAAILAIFFVGIFNPYGIVSLPVTAVLASAIGGLSPLIWMMQWFKARMFKKIPGEPLIVRRNWGMIRLTLLFIVLFATILGRTIYF